MKSIVELINELNEMDDQRFAERFDLASLDTAYYRRFDFDNWLRRCVDMPSQPAAAYRFTIQIQP